MKHIEQQPMSARTRVRRSAGTVLFLAVLGLTGCGGGGGGGGGGGSDTSAVKVQAVLPTSGPFVGGTLIRVTGKRFLVDEANVVTVGGNPATDVVVVDDTTLSCRTRSGTAGATVEVEVSNRLVEGRLASAFSFNEAPFSRSD